jgi:hypothetical protein
MNQSPAPRLGALHLALLDTLDAQRDSLSTAQLREYLDTHPRLESPVVHEAVYRALRRLRRLGRVDQHPSKGRDTLWTISRSRPGGTALS